MNVIHMVVLETVLVCRAVVVLRTKVQNCVPQADVSDMLHTAVRQADMLRVNSDGGHLRKDPPLWNF